MDRAAGSGSGSSKDASFDVSFVTNHALASFGIEHTDSEGGCVGFLVAEARPEAAASAAAKTKVLVCIDKSGSMCGARIAMVNKYLTDAAAHPDPNYGFAFFDNYGK